MAYVAGSNLVNCKSKASYIRICEPEMSETSRVCYTMVLNSNVQS